MLGGGAETAQPPDLVEGFVLLEIHRGGECGAGRPRVQLSAFAKVVAK